MIKVQRVKVVLLRIKEIRAIRVMKVQKVKVVKVNQVKDKKVSQELLLIKAIKENQAIKEIKV